MDLKKLEKKIKWQNYEIANKMITYHQAGWLKALSVNKKEILDYLFIQVIFL